MVDPILHQNVGSPFSEKVRLALGYKGLHWRAVEIPRLTPKPDLVPLTAGYARTPVLQFGADIFCDTSLMLREIDRRHPQPTLYPGGQHGLCSALSLWVERTTFLPAATVTMSFVGDNLTDAFIEERKRTMRRDFGKAASLEQRSVSLQRLHAALGWLADMMRDGRPFLLGEALSAADLSAYHPLWMMRGKAGADAEALLPLEPLLGWMERVAAVGHGSARDMTAEEALAAAREATPEPLSIQPDADPSGLRPGQRVSVAMDDVDHDPIEGELVGADAQGVVIRHTDPRSGTVHVHFPRAGYKVRPI